MGAPRRSIGDGCGPPAPAVAPEPPVLVPPVPTPAPAPAPMPALLPPADSPAPAPLPDPPTPGCAPLAPRRPPSDTSAVHAPAKRDRVTTAAPADGRRAPSRPLVVLILGGLLAELRGCGLTLRSGVPHLFPSQNRRAQPVQCSAVKTPWKRVDTALEFCVGTPVSFITRAG